MAKKAQDTPAQPELDFSDGKSKTLPITDDDIGGELLPILSKGLYTNPLDCIREYVQNGVDAGATEIKIKITGNSVLIFDNGSGMNMAELIHSRRFGVSPKTPEENAGFRGIGIYSGYDLSNRLVMITKKGGDDKVNTMRFDFRGMKNELESVRKVRGDNKIPLNELLTTYTTFNQESGGNTDLHYTLVQLEDISDTHIFRLSNRVELRNYILQNLPVDFDPAFEHRTEIIENLTAHVPGFKAVRIILQSDDAEDEVVAKPRICNLQRPTFNYIKNSEKQNIAYYWSCLNKQRSRIEEESNSCPASDPKALTPTPQNVSEYQGFLYKCKGFTVGNRQKLRPMFTGGSGTLYHWYTGEIYVLDPKVIPNAERYDFETNPSKISLEVAVREALQGLEKEAENYRSKGLADEKITTRAEEFEALQANFNNKKVDPSDVLLKLDQIIKEVKKHKSKASADKKEVAQTLVSNAEKFQKQIRHDIDRSSTASGSSTSTSTTRSRGTNTNQSEKSQSDGRGQTATGGYGRTEASRSKTLSEVLKETDYVTVENLEDIIAIVDSVIIDLIGVNSSQYQAIVSEIEARLQSEFVEE